MRTKCVQFCSPELGAAINTNANSTRKNIARQLLRFIAAPRCVLWITTRQKVLHRLQHASAKRHCCLPVLRSRRRHASRLVVLPKTGGGAQRQAAVVVQLLSTSPAHGISLALYFDLRPEPQPLPVRPLGMKVRPQPWLGSEPNVRFAVRTGTAPQTAFYGNCWWWR